MDEAKRLSVNGNDASVAFGAPARRLVHEATSIQSSADRLLREPEERAERAKKIAREIRLAQAVGRLRDIPSDRIQEVTNGRLRLGPLKAAGYRTVADVYAARPGELLRVPGVGPQTAAQAVAAAHQIATAVADDAPLRLDPDQRTAKGTQLLQAVRSFEIARSVEQPLENDLEQLSQSIAPLLAPSGVAGNWLRMLIAGKEKRRAAREVLQALAGILEDERTVQLRTATSTALDALSQRKSEASDPWRDFERRASDYFSSLAELGELDYDVRLERGALSAEIVEAVERQQLDLTALDVSLRGYQAFGAKFALVQERTLLGDEMGLGKTIEALAVMAHLASLNMTHALVVSPASVLVNWIQEITRRSRLRAHRLHGDERDRNLRHWTTSGGVAVTTYDTLRSLNIPDDLRLALLVADEAHYVKNPSTLRAEALRQWLPLADRVLFLTGTPMENRVEEFKTLLGYLQPDVAERIGPVNAILGPSSFREAIAPAYLRRNQADVLAELPGRLEAEDWVELRGSDATRYREAVSEGNFMAMRRAAIGPDSEADSSKLSRLLDLVGESAEEGWKVVVFSYFLSVLDTVAAQVGGAAMPVLTGRLRPDDRQRLVDDFTARDGHVVLVSQIEAGGVGLNLQAASVVILTEPQWKPSVEEQAIARLDRMGQVRRVRVHRLLAKNSVDERMLEVLGTKRALFNEYVADSAMKHATPQAIDVTELEKTSQVVVEARIIAAERRRLGIDPPPTPEDAGKPEGQPGGTAPEVGG